MLQKRKNNNMQTNELNRLLSIQYARNHAFRPSIVVTSRRTAKSKGKGTGQILKSSRIVSEVPIEKVFITRQSL